MEAYELLSKEFFSSLSVSTCPHLPSQIAKSGPFANELNAEQYAKQPDRSYREAGPKIESDQYRNDAARQEPTPVRKGPYRQRKNHLRNSLDHEVHEQQERQHEKARPSMTNQKHADYHRQDDRDKLKPEMGHVARVDDVYRQSISDSWLGNLRECLAHLV